MLERLMAGLVDSGLGKHTLKPCRHRFGGFTVSLVFSLLLTQTPTRGVARATEAQVTPTPTHLVRIDGVTHPELIPDAIVWEELFIEVLRGRLQPERGLFGSLAPAMSADDLKVLMAAATKAVEHIDAARASSKNERRLQETVRAIVDDARDHIGCNLRAPAKVAVRQALFEIARRTTITVLLPAE